MPKNQSQINQSDTVELQFVGDISPNGLVCNPEFHPELTRNMAELATDLGQCDLRCGNWEAPLWGDDGVNVLKQPRLCTTLDAAKCILPLGFDVALLANNHAYDCLEKGFENTVRFFDDNGISYVGAGRSQDEAAKPLILKRRGMKLGLLNYLDPETHPSLPSDARVFLNLLDDSRLLAEVAGLANQVDIVLVNLHWGTEFVRYPSLEQRRLARRAVEAGAKVVACHHSHCLQGYEGWKGGYIFYSLGNFLFYGLTPRQWPKLSRRTAVATCIVSKTKVEQINLTYLYQDGITLKRDQTRSREKMQNSLNRGLKLTDAKYKRLRQREVLLQWAIISPFRFIKKSGGLMKALRRLRWQHVVMVFDILTGKA